METSQGFFVWIFGGTFGGTFPPIFNRLDHKIEPILQSRDGLAMRLEGIRDIPLQRTGR